MSRFFQKYYEERGVRFAPGAAVDGVETGRVSLSNGTKLDADLVVAGIGVTPVTDIAQAAGVTVENGIRVDEFLKTNVDGIYAAGDAANYHDLVYGKQRRVEHWDNAVNHGQYLARHLSGNASLSNTSHTSFRTSSICLMSSGATLRVRREPNTKAM
jgi:NADPH-dependent 2,4-dienoyl-CoA reductase/sulfur reductase-like enzyme